MTERGVLDCNAGTRAGAVRHLRSSAGIRDLHHRHRGLTWISRFVPEKDPVKILRLRIRNDTTRLAS